MKLFFFFLTIGPTSFIDWPKKYEKNQSPNQKLFRIKFYLFLILSLDNLSFAKKKIYRQANWPVDKKLWLWTSHCVCVILVKSLIIYSFLQINGDGPAVGVRRHK